MAKEDVADTGAFPLARGEGTGANGAGRALRRRRGLPSGRAVVGGLLVAVAAVGTFGAWSASTAPPKRAYLVARRAIPVGHRITAADLARQPLDLPDRFPGFTDPADVVGASALGPLGRGELIQPGMVSTRGRAPSGSQVSFSIERPRALNGDIRPGDRVDLLATYGDRDAYTVAVLRHVLVVDVGEAGGALAQRSEIVLTLAVTTGHDLLAATHAIRAGNVTVARSDGTGVDPADDGSLVYFPPVEQAGPEQGTER